MFYFSAFIPKSRQLEARTEPVAYIMASLDPMSKSVKGSGQPSAKIYVSK